MRPETAELLVTRKVDVVPGAPMRYGYGFYDMEMEGDRMRGHSGNGGNIGFGAHAEMLWDRDITLIVLGNCDPEEVRPLTGDLARFLARQVPVPGSP